MIDERAGQHLDAVRAVMTAGDQLDDVKRARLWARLEARLDEEDDASAAALPRRWWRWVTAGVLTAVAATAVALVVVGHRAEPAPALVAADHTTLTAAAGPYARVALIGPARVEVVDPGEATTLHVRTGTLLATFEGGPGRSLRVDAPALTVEVVGTLFAIEVSGERSCVSVAHGRVRVTTPVTHGFVGTGERWCSDDHRPGPIEPRVRDALVNQERVLVADAPGQVSTEVAVVSPAPPPVPAPAPPASAPPLPSPTRTRPAAAVAPPPPPPALRLPSPIRPPAAPAPAPVPGPPPTAAPPVVSPPVVVDAPRHPEPTPMITSAPAPAPAPVPPAPAPAPAPAPPAPAAPATAAELYHSAEALLGRGDAAGADRQLARILAAYPTSSVVDQVLYDRARLAMDRGAWRDARADLEQLFAITDSPLAEPAHYLACRVARASGDAGAVRCFTAYRAMYPHSPHDLDVLALLIQIGYANGGCAAVRASLATLVVSYPNAAPTHAWQARCPATEHR